ncbi:hypothetical protein QA634_19535 [Methylobacterium sp. CB376]|uniref:hypothetical protein n=1 Tax=unclassified Methylobacterium TaxID=2615210 RepID=UPI0005BE0CBC|nr:MULTISPECIES: hypothetical protein [Methylobacterium]WFT77519.1 hypothetical protein QA634_19535 [Methylobacterium nodulans]
MDVLHEYARGEIESVERTVGRCGEGDGAADPARLVIGVGTYRLGIIEIGARSTRGSQLYMDDTVGAPGEAGDVVAAETDWASVKSLATALDEPPDFSRPIFLKSVRCGAWDLAACRVARARPAC